MDSIDKFGRHLTKSKIKKSARDFQTDYDLKNKQSCKVKSPVEKDDCANKQYVDKVFKNVTDILKKAKSPHLKLVTELAQLQIDFDKLKYSDANNTKQISELFDDVSRIKKLAESYTDKVDSLTRSIAKVQH